MNKVIVVFAAAACFFFLPRASGQEDTVIIGLPELRQRIVKGEYAEAVREAQLAISSGMVKDSLGEYRLLAGQAWLEEGGLDSARAQFDTALALAKGQSRRSALLRAGAWSGLGEYYLKTGNWAKAQEYHRQALQTREEIAGKLSEEAAASLNNLGNAYLVAGDYAQAFRYHIRALDIRQAVLPSGHPDLAVSFNNLGNCSLFQGKYEDAIRYYQQALDLRREILGEEHPKMAQVYNNLGRAYFETGNFDAALKSYQRSVDIRIKQFGAEHPALASLYENIGDVLLEQFASREAERYFRLAYSLYPEEQAAARAAAQHKIGLCLQARGEEEEALSFHEEALDVLEAQYGTSHPFLASVLSNLGNGHLRQGRYSKALSYLRRATGIFKTAHPQGHPDLVQSLNMEAVCLLRLKKPEEALVVLRQAEMYLDNPQSYTPDGKALTLKNEAFAAQDLGRYREALSLVRNALGLLWPDRNVNRVNRVLTPEILSLLVLESQLMPRTGSRYADAASLLETALQLSNRLRLTLSEEGRGDWAASNYALFAEAVETNFQAWKFTGRQSYLLRAFQLSEQYKGQTLLEAVRQTQTVRIKGISSRLLTQKQELENELTQLEKQHWIAMRSEQTERENELNRQIIERRQQLEKVRKQLLAESPEYAQLFETPKNIRLSSIRQTLDNDQALLEYFVSDSLFFLFVLTKDTLQGFRLSKKFPLDTWVKDFRYMIRQYPNLSQDSLRAHAVQWTQLSHQLYKRLLAPAIDQMNLPARLVIVPDGILHYLPFEALLSAMPQDATRYKSHPYLIQKHSLSYAYSASLLQELERIPQRGRFWGKYLLTLAPDFANNSFGLQPLAHNVQESNALRKLFGGRQLKGQEATLYNFLSLAPQFRVLHLATHGQAAPGYNEFSYLAFTERRDNKDNEFLYAGDLYNLRLRADLVVLSACETGVGAYRHGEGMLGLGRGFFFAGAKSLMSTLWSVDDARIAALVQRSFFYLRKGISKDLALQRAKTDFLEQYPHDEAHPFYWSGLLLSGDTISLPDPRLKWLISWLLGLSGLGLAVFLYWKWIRKPKVMG